MTTKSEPQHFTRSTLLSRGWSEKLIAQLLVAPDKHARNPHYRTGPEMRLYLRARVLAAEKTGAFTLHLAGRDARRARARKGTETKRSKTVSAVARLQVNLPQLSLEELAARAAAHYEARQHVRAGDERAGPVRFAPWEEPDAFRDRICVNYLRHACTGYDRMLRALTARVGRSQAHRVLFARIVSGIGERYPALQAEAERQFKVRWQDEDQEGAGEEAAQGRAQA